MSEPSIRDAELWALEQLQHSESPAADSRALLSHVLDKPRSYLMTWPERPLTVAQWKQFQQLVGQRQQGHPVAHLVGRREFWSLPLRVDNSTLIPRPDTEMLVEAALSLSLPTRARVLDLGTGTGAIALALKSERPHWQITAVDQSAEAVALAGQNATELALDIDVRQSDWFSAIDGAEAFDLIVSNPPYIAADDPHLQQGDVRFEPASALVADNQGMADIEWIVEQALAYLNDDGWLLLEQGWQQANLVVEQLTKKGYKKVNRWVDYGSVERITGGQKQLKEGTI